MTKHNPEAHTADKKAKRSLSMPTVLGLVILVALLFFIIGTRNHTFLHDISLRFDGSAAPKQLDLSSVQSTYNSLSKHFDGELNTSELIEGANRGLVEAAGDPYTAYFNSKEAKEFQDGLDGTFSGIGAELGKRDEKLTIITTLDNSPAKEKGLKANDVIVRVNDVDASSWSVDKAINSIRGEENTSVKLTIIRNEQEVIDFDITRRVINDPSVKSEITKNNIGVMRISRFGEGETLRLARAAAQDFADNDVKGVVVDVRGNGGGYLETVVDIAGIWLNNKTVVTERSGNEVIEELKTGNDAILEGIKTVVLINGGSASASEILAGSLKDNNAATLIGEKSFGKGSVQQIVNLFDGALLKVTVAKWYTPSGQNIDQEGIRPDVEVVPKPDDTADGQLNRALQFLAE